MTPVRFEIFIFGTWRPVTLQIYARAPKHQRRAVFADGSAVTG